MRPKLLPALAALCMIMSTAGRGRLSMAQVGNRHGYIPHPNPRRNRKFKPSWPKHQARCQA